MASASPRNYYLWIAQIVVALILVQTLFFKFTAAPESVYIFTTLGAEPWGRIGSGIMELVAAILLVIPRSAASGAVLSAGAMFGALAAHLGPLGVVVQDDGGLLFALAMTALLLSASILWLRRKEIPLIGSRLPF
ncbi:MAG: DoxX family protein [Leptospirales bacterium]|nr:DoxX family protein [Leptospirales bacterium]